MQMQRTPPYKQYRRYLRQYRKHILHYKEHLQQHRNHFNKLQIKFREHLHNQHEFCHFYNRACIEPLWKCNCQQEHAWCPSTGTSSFYWRDLNAVGESAVRRVIRTLIGTGQGKKPPLPFTPIHWGSWAHTYPHNTYYVHTYALLVCSLIEREMERCMR